jgi:signal transduction histidine kinase/CheY-like chemotaxis protein/HPt (histidine-containing phosphotransfer) domain-containing protein
LALRSLAQLGIALLGLCSIALVWGAIAHTLSAERDAAIRGAYLNAANLARAFEENIVRSLSAVDQTLVYVREAYERDPAHFDIGAWTRSTTLAETAFQIALIDRRGIMRASTLPSSGPPPDLSDREHFRVHVDNPRDEMFISKPIFGRVSNKWSIQLTRKMTAPDGTFDGVVVVSLDPEYLSRYYNSVDLGKDGVVVLLGTDGYFRARAGRVQLAGDDVLGKSGAQGPILRAYAVAPAGVFAARATVDGIKRFYAYRGVGSYPLVLSVAFAEAEVLAVQAAEGRSYCLLGGLVTVLLLAVTGMLLARQAQMNRARARLRTEFAQKSEQLEAALENMSQGIVMLDGDGRVQVCNRHFIEKLDLPDELMATRPAFEEVLRWLWEHGEFGAEAADFDAWLARFRGEGALIGPLWVQEHVRPNGDVVEVRAKSMPDGRMVRTYTNITARKHTEAVLRAALAEADRATRAKSVFLATMSHEIRSPMSGLLGVHNLLRATELTAEQRRMADMVHESAMMLLAVLNDILDFSKIEAGALAVAPEPVDLRRLAGGVAEPHVASAARRGVAVTWRVDDAVPEWVMTDGLRLRQILGNLTSNAVKFTASGEIAMRIEVSDDGGMLRCAVRDSGIGMSEDVLARLFQPFTQADGSTTRDYGGTGLGLCISRELAGLLGGDLSATSKPGVGSEFTLRLPLVACAAPPAAADDAAAGSAAPAPAPWHGRVLVVDDDATNRWLTQRQFELMGFAVDVAENGEAALAVLLASVDAAASGAPGYDLLVTDCHMPRMDGVALTQAVRASPHAALRALPVIGLTADATETQRERCRAAGMTDMAIKPLMAGHLRALVARVLPRGGVGGAAPQPAAAPARRLRDMAFDDQIYREIFPVGDADADAAGAAWLTDYLATARGEEAALAGLLAAGAETPPDDEAVATVAHRLAGASFSVGAMRLGGAASALDKAAKRRDTAALPALQEQLRAEFVAAEAAIKAFVAVLEVRLAA